ncbi:hypothetical protein RFI_30427, partial [Reticulomyxa filosa]
MSTEMVKQLQLTSIAPKEDILYLEKAFGFLKSMTPPSQSNFRVVAVITYYDIEIDINIQKTFHFTSALKYVIGCNAEPSQMEGSLCGERNCLLQLCALNPHRAFTIESVYVVTDHTEPVMCGSLCLEFLSSMACPFTRMVFAAKDDTISPPRYLYNFHYLKDLYLFPSLLKFVPFPNPLKLKAFADVLLEHAKEDIEVCLFVFFFSHSHLYSFFCKV